MSIRVALVEDDSGLRESLTALIQSAPGFICVSVHPNAEDALRSLRCAETDVLLVDINLPKKSGIELVRELKMAWPNLQFVMLTVYDDSAKIFESLGAGASGYLLKRTEPHKILEAIDEVFRGGSPMSASIARLVVNSFRAAPVQPSLPLLSPREQEVLDWVAQGARSKEIAIQLGISVHTVHTYVKQIYEKLHVHSRAEAVAKYMRR